MANTTSAKEGDAQVTAALINKSRRSDARRGAQRRGSDQAWRPRRGTEAWRTAEARTEQAAQRQIITRTMRAEVSRLTHQIAEACQELKLCQTDERLTQLGTDQTHDQKNSFAKPARGFLFCRTLLPLRASNAISRGPYFY